jgi:hypothetical protein
MTIEMTPQQLARIKQLLDESAQAIDSKTLARLAESRGQALDAFARLRQVAKLQPAMAGWGRLVELSGQNDVRLGLFALILLMAMAAVISSSINRNNPPLDTDSSLLASELPPETFADKEFVVWLEHTSHL